MIETDNEMARDTLRRIETTSGAWFAYGNDGRVTTREVDAVHQEAAGDGVRARFVGDGDYGWGPLGQTESEAIALFLAERVAIAEQG
jgi:hypothetical protein